MVVLPNRRALKLVVDSLVTKHQNNVDVLFLATEQNTILKYMVSSSTTAPTSSNPMVCFLEEVDVLDAERKKSNNAINNMVLLDTSIRSSSTNRELLIATSFNLVKMSVANCETQTNYFSCLSALDPYCIWDSRAQKCLLIFNTNETLKSQDRRSLGLSIKQNAFLHQHPMNSCPTTNIPG